MSVYTVHEPPPRAADAAPEADRIAFVRDGFSMRAFLFAPLWMLWHRMWLVLVCYVVVLTVLEAAMVTVGASSFVMAVVAMLISLLVGLEAGTLRRWTLSRLGWKNVGVVSGDDLEDAERRFFDAWAAREVVPRHVAPSASAPSTPPGGPIPRRPQAPDVIGLFPEPGGNR